MNGAQLGRPQWSLSDLDRLRYSQKFSIIRTLLSVVQPAAAIYSLTGAAKLNGLDRRRICGGRASPTTPLTASSNDYRGTSLAAEAASSLILQTLSLVATGPINFLQFRNRLLSTVVTHE
jgi:hypothetical protein